MADPQRRGRGETGRRRLWWLAPALIIALSNLMVLSASGQLPQLPVLNDLLALGQLEGQTPAKAPVQRNGEPPLTATPQVKCLDGSRPEPGVQGRVPAGSADKGLQCNAEQIGHQGKSGGFKVLDYVDEAGRHCAFYDTALLFPFNAFKLDSSSIGVAVLDLSDPANPRQTDTLTQPAMMSPHESLALNTKRGLLAAVTGNPSTYPGVVSVYDASKDCRHPVHQSTFPSARLGHESGFAQDGRTFYATGTANEAITAVDVSDPKNPHVLWHGNVSSHGMSLSNDGNRAYLADTDGMMTILDVSEIQARKPDPQAREVSRLTWERASIPQNAIPFTRDGKPYILEFDEYTEGTGVDGGDMHAVGAARIIDISDETRPQVITNIRLAVNNPAEHEAAADDPGALSPVQGYAAHYCNIPTRVNPQVVACSFILSGLRVFDISNLREPKEIAYYVAPTTPVSENGFQASNFAMSQPAFGPARQIYFTDGASGFYNVRVDERVWPGGGAPGKCAGRKATIVGTNGKDRLKGSKRRDVISVGRGKDRVDGRGGNDLVCGGKGRDRLAGGRGRDKLLGKPGRDRLFGGAGKDLLRGGRGKDLLRGGRGRDFARQ